MSDIYVTHDGGYSWRRRWSGMHLTTIGANDAWALEACGDYSCDVIWRTTDGGKRWRPIARPDRMLLSAVSIIRGRIAVDVGAEGGPAFTSAEGRHWTLDRVWTPPPPRLDAVATAYATRERGFMVAKPVFVDERCGLHAPVEEARARFYATNDGGRTWTRRRQPFEIGALAARRGILAAVGVRRCSVMLGVSHDGGRRWAVRRLPRFCTPAVAPGRDVWLFCDATIGRSGHQAANATLLRSDDDVRSWSRIRLPAAIVSLAPRNGREAWALIASPGGLNRLWRTLDGGKTWKQIWPAFPTRG